MDDLTMGGGTPPDRTRRTRRNRVRFSCSHCRDKKLKCNRVLPCDQCVKRNLGPMCQYMPYTAYGESVGESAGGHADAHTRRPSLKRNHAMTESPYEMQAYEYETSASTAAALKSTGGTSRRGSVDEQQQQQLFPSPLYPSSGTFIQHHQHQQQHQHRHDQHQQDRRRHQLIPRSHPQQQPRPRPQPQPQTPFLPLPPPLLHDTSSQSVPERLKYLERLVLFLKARNRDQQSPASLGPAQAVDNSDGSEYDDDAMSTAESFESIDSASASAASAGVAGVADPGTINVAEFRYADPSNWDGVLDDIVGLTRDLVLADDTTLLQQHLPGGWDFGLGSVGQMAITNSSNDSHHHNNNTLALFAGYSGLPPGPTDMLRFLPPRPVVDVLVDRFFASLGRVEGFGGVHTLRLLFHAAAFRRQYDAFWSDPPRASPSYLALLFLVLAHAALAFVGGDNDSDNASVPASTSSSPARAVLGSDPLAVVDACRHRAAQCLILGDYARPGRHKIEALVLYYGVEYLWQRRRVQGSSSAAGPSSTGSAGSDAATLASTAMVLALAVRLAMHMGYHRDPSHAGGRLRPFDAEMRRRVWLVLVNLDRTASAELRLPSNVRHGWSSSSARPTDSDTALPCNLHDSDLYEDMPALPPARPPTERTGVLYATARATVLAVVADILQLRPVRASSSTSTLTPGPTVASKESVSAADPAVANLDPLPTPPTSANTPAPSASATTSATNSGSAYDARVMQLDRRLTAAYRALPACLRLRGDPATATATAGGTSTDRDPFDPRDPPDLCVERVLLEILYQHARLVLHRRFQGTERASPRYAYARWACLDAAVRLLRHQYDVYVAVQDNGSGAGNTDNTDNTGHRFAGHRSLLLSDSAVTHAFLLADTALCLEVAYASRQPAGVDGAPASVSLPQLLGLLRTSRSIWAALQGTSSEAARAYHVLTRVLADADGEGEEEEEEEDDDDDEYDYDSNDDGDVDDDAAAVNTATTAVPGHASMSTMATWTASSTAARAWQDDAPAVPAAPPTTTEATAADSSGTSGSTTPRYGEASAVQRQDERQGQLEQLQQQQQQQPQPQPQGIAFPQLTSPTQLWSGQMSQAGQAQAGQSGQSGQSSGLLPVLVDMAMPSPVNYGLSMQSSLTGVSGLPGLPGLTPGLLPTMPLHFPTSSADSASLLTPLDDSDSTQALADAAAAFPGDWNTLWPRQDGQ
ncbi:uncharacterized protein SPSK_01396 [Sporothrix schenckii 1099-18]|uniref:Zn(2)-C6 fungal-type domain-containing protein n=1 Tax=Sporothrix schenckii 1099-18 TaxID=1397361 RepID=A0A0F2MCS5_SPOSC|nr:uncharacterized protein SPSK_01396 [Sporothrix schenckii 1099-18]KJR87483.1 hypothetical protein SPSK_01396 [Sporothrix schenckii 1099-18]